ncbi:glycosyl hydrolase family 18 protein [Paenibacillus guangzhouensis]|uniref:glycosyl hydrolase family 18 protein n=1 Tax=Paenibacillus guangzhouensis TaxID=1473112 RepID=UPI0012672439|nr:glycosyl hydrolase family 18 protein [Paenibacillus guangzhouensis]
MKKSLALFGLIVTLLSSNMSFGGGIAKAASAPPIVLGYYTVDTGNDLNAFGSNLTHLSTDTFNTDMNGNLIGNVPTDAVNYANQHGIVSYALVSNYNDATYDWDSALAHTVLTNPSARSNLINNMLKLVKDNHYKGINIDFEGMLATEGPNFTSFVHDVATVMKQNNFYTMVSVPAKTEDNPNDSWTYPFDFTALGQDADLLQMMTYDEYGVWSDSGPVSSKSFITNALDYAVQHVSPSKLLMGIPAYGNDWNLSDPTNSSNVLMYSKDIPNLMSTYRATPTRDAATGSMYFKYKTNGQNHIVWYEDALSIAQKTNYTVQYGLAGVSIYSLGEEDATFWEAIRNGLSSGATAAAIPGKIEAENYQATANTSLENTSDVGGGKNVGWNGQGGWLDYVVYVQSAGVYNVDFRVASPVTGGVFQIRDSYGTLLGSINIPKTGGYQTWKTATTTIALPAGLQSIRISMPKGDPNLNWLNFTKQP